MNSISQIRKHRFTILNFKTMETIYTKTFERTAVYKEWTEGNLIRRKKIAEFTDTDQRNEAARYVRMKEESKLRY